MLKGNKLEYKKKKLTKEDEDDKKDDGTKDGPDVSLAHNHTAQLRKRSAERHET